MKQAWEYYSAEAYGGQVLLNPVAYSNEFTYLVPFRVIK